MIVRNVTKLFFNLKAFSCVFLTILKVFNTFFVALEFNIFFTTFLNNKFDANTRSNLNKIGTTKVLSELLKMFLLPLKVHYTIQLFKLLCSF